MNVVYGKDNCPFCVKAKELLESKGMDYQYVDIDKISIDTLWFRSQDYKTVPQIFMDESHVGGYEELELILSF